MSDGKKISPASIDFPQSVVKLWKQVQTNTEEELKEIGSAESKFTRKTGMEEPDLDIGKVPYDSSEQTKKKG